MLSQVQLFATPWTGAHQAPLSVEFFRQEYWSGLPFPSPEDLPNPGTEPTFPALADGFFISELSRKSSHEITHSLMSNSVVFSTLTRCSHFLYLVLKHFQQPKGKLTPIKQLLPIPSCSWPLTTTNLSSVSMDLPILAISYK